MEGVREGERGGMARGVAVGVGVTKTLKTHNLVSGSVGISGLRLNSKYILT